jgi:hypothetical protein
MPLIQAWYNMMQRIKFSKGGEKLVVSFSLVKTAQGQPILIIKNLSLVVTALPLHEYQ